MLVTCPECSQLSHHRPVQALWAPGDKRLPEFLGGKVVSPKPQEISLVFISVRGWVDSGATVQLEGLSR